MNPNQPQDPGNSVPPQQDQPFEAQPMSAPTPTPTPPAAPEGQPIVDPTPVQPPVVPPVDQPAFQPFQNQPAPVEPQAQSPVPPVAQPATSGFTPATPPVNGGNSKKKIIMLASIIGGAVVLLISLVIAAYFLFFNVTQADYQQAADQLNTIDEISFDEALGDVDAGSEESFKVFEETVATVKSEHETLGGLKAFRGGDGEVAAAYNEYKTAYTEQINYIDRFTPFVKVVLKSQAVLEDGNRFSGDTYRDVATEFRNGAETVDDEKMKNYLTKSADLYDRFATEVDRLNSSSGSGSNNLVALGDEMQALQDENKELFERGGELAETSQEKFDALSELIDSRLS